MITMRILTRILLLLLALSCGAANNLRNTIKSCGDSSYTTYKCEIDSLFTLHIKINNDSLVGNHCFVSTDGQIIDCCLFAEGHISLHLNIVSDGIFKGVISDCYDYTERNVIITLTKDTLLFTLLPINDVMPHILIDYNQTLKFHAISNRY